MPTQPSLLALTAPAPKEKHVDLDARRLARGRMRPAQQRAEEKRQAKLEEVRRQTENGELVVRQMTDSERRRFPPKPVEHKRRRKW